MAYTSKNPRKQLPGTYINVPVIHEDSNDVAIFESLADIAEECVQQGISFDYRLYRALPVLVKNVHAFGPDSSVLEGQPNRFNPNPLPLSSRLQAEMRWVTYLLFDELQRVAPSGCFFGPSPEGVIGFWQKKQKKTG